jgi:pilus assembly protein Flp/PilA
MNRLAKKALHPEERTMIRNFKNIAMNLLNDDSGQDLIEYALCAGIIALGAAGAMGSVTTAVTTAFASVTTSI